MSDGFKVPVPVNEPIKDYAPNSIEKKSLVAKINELSSMTVEIPIIIDGKEIKTGDTGNCVKPYDHAHVLGIYHKAGENEVKMAIESSLDAWNDWSQTSFEHRANIFLKMAELLAGPHRDVINASTMLNMSKNAYQAEIDAACELIDFWNFNCYYAEEIYKQQPMYSPEGTKNQTEHRPLEGFVFAVTPFNFTSIAANLPSAPALMGNTAIWKPASSTVYPAYFLMKLFKEAGLPDGVINLLPGSGAVVGNQVMSHPKLAGIHFTGSTGVFQGMWKHIGENIKSYESYPRIVGETGGKDFCVAHESCNKEALATAMTRGAFEFQGQKCSAMSRAYISSTIWDEVKDRLNDSAFALSGGQQQRLCIARALAVEPEVVLMDEPASALDPIATLAIEDLVRELKKTYTIVIVTHNMQQAARVSDETAFFMVGEDRSGYLVEQDDTQKIFTNPTHQRTEEYITGRFS